MQNLTKKLESLLGVKKTPSPEEEELFQKSQYFTHYINWIPGIRMVAVSNSLAMYATHAGSDIDFFIITAPHRLWIIRTLVLAIATLLRVRTKPGDEAGKFCFPFFMTEKNFSLKRIAIENDVYLAYWIMTLKPLYNKQYTYGRFMKINETFCSEILGTPDSEETADMVLEENRNFLKRSRRGVFFENYHLKNPFSPLLDALDTKLGNLSKKRIHEKNTPPENTEGIIVNDDMCKLHFNDRRREIREKIISMSK